jgi:hypothetical protein
LFPCKLAKYTVAPTIVFNDLIGTVTTIENKYAEDCLRTLIIQSSDLSFDFTSPADYTYEGSLLTLKFPGEFKATFTFDENISNSRVVVVIFIDPCPLTYFIENTPNPYIIDGLSVQIPELEDYW